MLLEHTVGDAGERRPLYRDHAAVLRTRQLGTSTAGYIKAADRTTLRGAAHHRKDTEGPIRLQRANEHRIAQCAPNEEIALDHDTGASAHEEPGPLQQDHRPPCRELHILQDLVLATGEDDGITLKYKFVPLREPGQSCGVGCRTNGQRRKIHAVDEGGVTTAGIQRTIQIGHGLVVGDMRGGDPRRIGQPEQRSPKRESGRVALL